jgi:hypothetical protein
MAERVLALFCIFRKGGGGMLSAAVALSILLFGAGPASAADVRVSADRNPVHLDESFTLTFTADGAPDGDPDFGPLESDFDILRRAQNSQMSLDNGRYSRRTEWQLTVMPKREGNLTVPPIAFGGDRSKALSITVTRGVAAGGGVDSDVFLEVEAEPQNPYVQAQALYSIRVFSRINFTGGELNEPAAENALIQRLGDDRHYTATRGGQTYKVIERKYAIFPQKSGPLRIEPLVLETQILTGGGRSLFSPFFSQTTRALRVRSDAVELQVRPIPAAFTGKHWLPAESLALEDSWSNGAAKTTVGEPMTRTITLRAQGATVGLLPELDPDHPGGGDIKRYPDQPLLNEEKLAGGITSVRQEKTALIPAQPGTYRLPAMEIPWWNTQTDKMDIAHLPERILTVLPAANAPPSETPRAVQPDPLPRSEPAAADAPPSVPSRSDDPLWFRLALVFAAGWLATAVAWWFSRKPARVRAAVPPAAEPPSERQAVEALKKACRAHDPGRAREALLQWAERRWPAERAVGLEELGRRCGGDLGREIERLNRMLYGREGEEWQGQALWQGFTRYAEQEAAGSKAPEAILEPLYR